MDHDKHSASGCENDIAQMKHGDALHPKGTSQLVGATQQAGDAAKSQRGLFQRKDPWKPPQSYHAPYKAPTPMGDAGQTNTSDHKMGFVPRKNLHRHLPTERASYQAPQDVSKAGTPNKTQRINFESNRNNKNNKVSHTRGHRVDVVPYVETESVPKVQICKKDQKNEEKQCLNPWKAKVQEVSQPQQCYRLDEAEYPPLQRDAKSSKKHPEHMNTPQELEQGQTPPQPEDPRNTQQLEHTTVPQQPEHSVASPWPDFTTAAQKSEPTVAPQKPDPATAPQNPNPTTESQQTQHAATPKKPCPATAPQQSNPATTSKPAEHAITPQKTDSATVPQQPSPAAIFQQMQHTMTLQQPQMAAVSQQPTCAIAPQSPQPITDLQQPGPTRQAQHPESTPVPQQQEPVKASQQLELINVPILPESATASGRPKSAIVAQQPENTTASQKPKSATAPQEPDSAGPLEEVNIKDGKVLLPEVEQLKQTFEKEKKTAKVKLDTILSQLSKSEKNGKNAYQKTAQVKEALEAERKRCKELETREFQQRQQISHLSQKKEAWLFQLEQLRYQMEGEKRQRDVVVAQKKEETFRMKAALAQANKDLDRQHCYCEEERSTLLAKHQDENSTKVATVVATLIQAQQERSQWQEERSSLVESLTNIKKTLEEKEATNVGLMDRLDELEKEMDEALRRTKNAIFA